MTQKHYIQQLIFSVQVMGYEVWGWNSIPAKIGNVVFVYTPTGAIT
jgi:hypothetical protein